LSSISEAFALY